MLKDQNILFDPIPCYNKTYSTSTTTFDIKNCCAENFDYLLVAGIKPGSRMFIVGAYGLSEFICVPSTAVNSPRCNNAGACWYFTVSESFGFAPSSEIKQEPADTLVGGDRLSWPLDRDIGGYRIGDIWPLTNSVDILKVIYGYKLCPIGQKSDTGLTPCTECEVGYYSDAVGSSFCKPCPSDTTTASPGSNSYSDCILG